MKKILIIALSLVSFLSYSQTQINTANSNSVANINTALKGSITATGTNTYAATMTNFTWSSGDAMDITFVNANSGTSTFNLNGSGALTLKKLSSGSLVDLVSGDILNGQRLRFYHNGTYLVLQSGGGSSGGGAWGTITGTLSSQTDLQSALDGKQPIDSDLTSIAGLSPTNDDIIQRKAGAWTNRTTTQVKTDLSLTKSDVGLSNVDNTSDASKPVSTLQAAADALNLKISSNLSDLNNASTARTNLGLSSLATVTPGTGISTFLATPSSSNLAGAVTDETGSGALVFGTSPSFTTPNIGTATGNITGNAATVTTNANLTGDVTSAGNATAIASGVIVDSDVNASAAIAGTKIANTPAGNIAATTSQAAINELDTEKSDLIKYGQTVYVDSLNGNNSTALINRVDKPYATIDAALDASTSFKYTIIRIGPGTYASPTPSKTRANTWFQGSGKPAYNVSYSQTAYATFTITHPTRLKGGTILQGNLQLIDKSNIRISDLGVDCGSAYVTAGGTEANCIGIASNTSSAPFPMITGIEILNVSTLGRNAASLFHGIVMENVYEPVLQNIDTYFATHGIALKGVGSNISNVRNHQHNLDGIILKSDSYAFNWRTRATNVEVNDCGTGIIVQYGSGSQGNGQVTVSNATIANCTTGVKLNALASGVSDAIHFNNIRVVSASSRGFDISTSAFTKISNCITRTCGDGFYVRTAATTSINILENCMAIQNSSDGFDVDAVGGGRILITNGYAAFSTAYGFNAGSNIDVAGYEGLTNTSGLLNGTMTSKMVNNPMTAVGDLIVGGTAGVPTALPDIAAGNVLTSGGPGVAPAYGKVTLTGHVSGILPVANGGTNTSTAFTAGSVVFAGASGTYTQDATNFVFDDTNNRLGIKRNTPLSSLDVDGSIGSAITTITTTTLVNETYNAILVDATSGAVTVNLPVAAVVQGREYVVVKIDASANTVTIDGNASETINGSTTQTLTTQYQRYKIKCNATAWYIIGD